MTRDETQGGRRAAAIGARAGDPSHCRAEAAALAVRRGADIRLIGRRVALSRARHGAGRPGAIAARRRNGQAPVDVLPTAVSGEESLARFHVAKRNRATNHLDGYDTSQTGGVRSTQMVPALTLDWLAARFPPPDIIKIDVEQAEVAVLAGGSRVLGPARAVICEVAAHNSAVVRDLLTGHGYTLYDGDRPASERVPVADAPANTLAVHISASTADSRDLDEGNPG